MLAAVVLPQGFVRSDYRNWVTRWETDDYHGLVVSGGRKASPVLLLLSLECGLVASNKENRLNGWRHKEC